MPSLNWNEADMTDKQKRLIPHTTGTLGDAFWLQVKAAGDEATFQALVIQAAKTYGWTCVHFKTIQDAKGYHHTPQDGDEGFPDMVLAKGGQPLIFWELKTNTGRLKKGQKVWAKLLGFIASMTPWVEYAVMRPREAYLIRIKLGG